ncbi:TetR/AcrR family transcriptional regulator [Candidatus Frankia alpina]|uniref:TetR/AcrR family transcriptional regulator n=1 Tax=Candidatus Frankia alpina TaxID=2699483 RepID=A0A4S5EQ08_9ACTN|nr:TetR/AcrR family transcriptional regulator [Candidatus Frankia alpina]THJ74445.1 TetR/AcrR family transcriptional regulator [Candidatus Frankia alpina]
MSTPVKAGEPEKRRLTKAGRKTRERIVETAAELMSHRGAGGTSIPDIQAAAGVSASQIYHYFGDKQGLVLAVIDHQTDAKLAQQRPLLDSIEALREWCDRAGDRQDAMGCEGGCEIGSLASELAERDQSVRTGLAAAFDRWEDPIRSGLARMQARGELSESADIAALATAVLAAIQGGMLLSQVRRSSTAYRQAVSAVIDHIESHLVR